MSREIISAPTARINGPERRELNRLEGVIVHAVKLQLEAAQALLRIRDCRLYRAEYPTFDEYCQARWNMSREQGRRLCNWAEVSANLEANATNGGILPLHESHARPLARLTPKQQNVAWHQIKKLPRPDARMIEKVCDEVSRTPTSGNGKSNNASIEPAEPLPPSISRPISWHGAKTGLASRIIELIPTDHTSYVEVFAGSLAVFFRKSPSRVEIINDLDADVVNLYRILRDPKKAAELQRLLKLTPYARDEHEFCRQHPEADNDVEKARRFFVRCRQSYAGEADGPWAHSHMRNRADEFVSPVDQIPAVVERLRHVQIEHADFRELLPQCDKPGVVSYLDPPYHAVKERYAHTMDESEHEQLLKMVCRFRRGRVILSGYRSRLYDGYLKAWRRYEIPKIMKAASTGTLLFPFVDVTNHHFHIDHVFPYSRFSKSRLKKAGVADEDVDEFKEMANCLPNLQLLEGAENIEKQAALPAEWMNENFVKATRTNYCDNHVLGSVPDTLIGFRAFYDARRIALRSHVVKILSA